MMLSRRQVVGGSALLVLGAGPDCTTINLDKLKVRLLKKRRAHLLNECERLDRRWNEARARMPWYWLPGPKFMNGDGAMCGGLVGWPADLSAAIELRNGLLLVRPSPRDLRELFEDEVIDLGQEAAIVAYRSRIQQLRDRLRTRRRWESEVGMPRTADWEPLDVEIDSIEAQLRSLLGKPPSQHL